MKKTFNVMLIGVIAFALVWLNIGFASAAPTAKAPGGKALDKLIAAAKQEGEVVWQGPEYKPETNMALMDLFEKKYGFRIKVTLLVGTGGQGLTQIITAASAGRPPEFDVFDCSKDTCAPRLLERGLDVPNTDWQELFPYINSRFITPRGTAIWGRNLVYVIGFNKKMISHEEVPDSYEKLLDPKLKGRKLLVDSRGNPFHLAVCMGWSKEKILDFSKKLKAQQPIVSKSVTTIVQALAAGQAQVGITDYGKILMYQSKGADTDCKWSPEVLSTTFLWQRTKGALHPNAAKLWVGFMASPEARRLVEDKEFAALAFPGAGSRQAEIIEKAGVKVNVCDMGVEEIKLVEEITESLIKIMSGVN